MSIARKVFYDAYDLDATTFKYGRYTDTRQGYGYAKTAGASVTITAALAGQGTFSPLVVGDAIYFRTSETAWTKRKVVTPGNDSIVVDTAIDLGATGVPFQFRSWRIGTGVDDGAHRVYSFETKTLLVESMVVAAAGGVDIQIEGRGQQDAGWVVIFGKNYAVTSPAEPIPIAEDLLDLRVGVKGGSGFAGTDTITIALEGAGRR